MDFRSERRDDLDLHEDVRSSHAHARARLAEILARHGEHVASTWLDAVGEGTAERIPELPRYIAALVAGLREVYSGRGWDFTQTIIDSLAEQRVREGVGLEISLQRALLAGRRALPMYYGEDDDWGVCDEVMLETLHECLFRFTESFQGLRAADEAERLHLRIIKSLVMALEARDAYTKGHSISVALIAQRLAEQLGQGLESGRVHLAGLLHDVGKVGIPDSILLKTDPLSEYEVAILRAHPLTGVKILKPINPYPEVIEGTLYHHENYDGSGYPEGRIGEAIPLVARILRVADSFDAMTSTRVYRPSRTVDEALVELKTQRGRLYDPAVVEALIDVMESPEAMKDLGMASLTIDMRDFAL